MGAAEEHSRPRVGTTGTAGPRNLILIIFLNGDVQISARSAVAFKSEVFTLLKGSREAMRDRRFRYQLKDSASGPPKHITEDFVRFSPLDFCRFLDYALGSLREAEGWIQDGIEFGYFRKEECQRAFWFGERCFTATLRLKHSQERYAEQLERERRARSKLKKADRNQVPRTRRTRRTD